MPKIIPLKKQLEDFKKICFSGKDASLILQIYNTCVSQTKDFVKNSGFDDVVVGLSGGVDSSIVAKIATDAFGKDHVHGLILPGPYTSQESISDANQLANNLGINTNTIFINSSYEKLKIVLESSKIKNQETFNDLTLQNIQARLRMIMIMAVSNENNWLMLNTSNKSEVYTGYSTLYGDMAGGFAPIGDVYKCDVYKMCVAKNIQEKRVFEGSNDIIPENIINRPATAELTENQTDEGSLGIDYATLDAILHEFIDNKRSVRDVVLLGYNQNEVQNVYSKIKKSEYKRRYEPPCATL